MGLPGIRTELAREYGVPFVVAGFEPLDLLQGLLMLVRQMLEAGARDVENQYTRAVRREGNPRARRRMLARVFETCDMTWRGIGSVPGERSAAARGLRRVRRRASASTSTQRCRPEESPDLYRRRRAARARRKPHECTRSAGTRARRSIRSGRRWSQRRAPAPPTTRFRHVGGDAHAECPIPISYEAVTG